MSAIKDFSKVWYEKFPGSELPPAWEEDVKNNLAKHKKRVEELQSELQQEEVYVQFLESLLEEVEKRKVENSADLRREPKKNEKGQERDISDVIKDTLERRSMMGSDHILSTTESFDDLTSATAPAAPTSSDPQKQQQSSSSHLKNSSKRNGSFSSADLLEEGASFGEEDEEEPEKTKNGGDFHPRPRTNNNKKNKAPVVEPQRDDDGGSDDSKDHFVTVIEVNGLEKEKGGGTSSSAAASLTRSSSDDSKRLKKVPPRPPPKSFKRPGQDLLPNNGRLSFSSFGIKDESTANKADKVEYSRSSSSEENSSSNKGDGKLIHRPVVFDSRSNSSAAASTAPPVGGSGGHHHHQSSLNSASSSNSSSLSSSCATNNKEAPPVVPSHNNPGKPQVFKKFEGSKLPLPPPPSSSSSSSAGAEGSRDIAKDRRNSSSDRGDPPSASAGLPQRSKIFDLVNKMEANSQQQQSQLNKPADKLTPKRSFKKPFKDTAYNSRSAVTNNSDSLMTDYMDPCDAEFELVSDQIYDSPPPEDCHSSPSHGNKNSLENRNLKRNTNKTGTMGSHGSCENNSGDFDSEPMYDTVAPDQDQEDDYVVLLEDENNPANTSDNSLPKNKNSLTRNGQDQPVLSSSCNPDASTIKSQASVISGHSITTTTSSGTTSDTEGLTGSPLPQDGTHDSEKNPSANYVNIEYFLGKSNRKDSRASGESEEDEPVLLRAISFDQDGDALESQDDDTVDANIDDLDIDSVHDGSMDRSGMFKSGGTADSRGEAATMSVADQEKIATYRMILSNIARSENEYVEVLNKLLQYMKAIKATLATSKPVLSTDEFNIIFYKIPELFAMHQKFLNGMQQKSAATIGVGIHFENLAKEVDVYGAFLQNYSRAVDTVRKCSQNNSDFAEITRSISLRYRNMNSKVSLETLLYSPVSRIQKNIEIIQDLVKHLPDSHPDCLSLASALREFQSFLNEFKMVQPEQLSVGSDRSPRHLVKNSFIVELSEGHRKLRHLFLFNDVLVCAKYKASGRNEKFTFELKWYIPVADCVVVEESTEPREATAINLVALRSQASTVRDQIKRQTSRDDSRKAKAEKQRKKLAELEAQLVLASPNLVFKVKASNGKAYTFFLSSEYERSQWVDAIEALKKQSSQPPASSQLSMNELQQWVTSSRKHLKTNMGSYLLRTGRDENLLVGDFYVMIGQLKGIQRPADLYICLELDSYGHFFRKAKTKMICGSTQPNWNQDFIIELEGAQNLRILLYEEHPVQGALIRATTTIQLSRNWLSSPQATEKKVNLQDYVLTLSTRFIPSELTIRRVPTAKPSGLFGAKITAVCKREKRQIPFIMTSCVREIERRGINEVGIYRVSGSASDVSRLKKAFETNSYEAEQLLKEVDVHSTTSLFKCYLRELPEALFTDDLYPRFFDAFNQHDLELRKTTLMQLFSTLPTLNQHIILFLLDHMVRINSHENHNKMSLHNLATVFGPTLLRPGTKNEGSGNIDLLAAGTADVMAQAGILYFFLTRRASNEPIQPSLQ